MLVSCVPCSSGNWSRNWLPDSKALLLFTGFHVTSSISVLLAKLFESEARKKFSTTEWRTRYSEKKAGSRVGEMLTCHLTEIAILMRATPKSSILDVLLSEVRLNGTIFSLNGICPRNRPSKVSNSILSCRGMDKFRAEARREEISGIFAIPN